MSEHRWFQITPVGVMLLGLMHGLAVGLILVGAPNSQAILAIQLFITFLVFMLGDFKYE